MLRVSFFFILLLLLLFTDELHNSLSSYLNPFIFLTSCVLPRKQASHAQTRHAAAFATILLPSASRRSSKVLHVSAGATLHPHD